MAKILITGGAGFIGYHLAKKLLEEGNEVILCDRSSDTSKDPELTELLKNKNVKMLTCDLTDPSSIEKLGSGYDHVYHLAGINGFHLFKEIPHEVLRVGILSTLNILEWLRTKNKNPNAKIVFTSSNEVYLGALSSFGSLPIPTPESVPFVLPDPYDPRFSYAGSKIIGELLFIHFAKAYNLRMSIARLHNIYGPNGRYQSMIPKMIERIAKKTDPFPLLGPNDLRSFCYIEDAVLGMKALMDSKKTDSQTYHIGGKGNETIKNLVETMFEIVNWKPTSVEESPAPAGSPAKDFPDISKIKKDTGWEPQTSLKEGLKKTTLWYLSHPKN